MTSIAVMQARRFAQEYVVDCNAIRAYIRAFGTKDADGNERTYPALRKAASKLLTKGNIKSEIAALQEELRKSCHISAKRMLRQLVAMATCDPLDFYDDDGTPKPLGAVPPMARRSIRKIKTKHDSATGTTIVEYTLQDRYPAIEKLCKRLGITKDNAEWAGLIAAGVAAIQAATKSNSDASKPDATNESDPVGGDASVSSA